MVLNRRITPNPDGTMKLKSFVYGPVHELCREEKFYNQRIAISCSAFLVGPKTLITAGHCVRTQHKCNDVSFIFGLSLKNKNKKDNFDAVQKEEIYRCKKLIKQVEEKTILGADFAVIELERNVTGHTPLQLRRKGKAKKGDALTVIGHPKGLPTKVADGATIIETKKDFFVTNLDSFSGNSGSAVFNSASGMVEGILVRGAPDFFYDPGRECFKSNVCDQVKPHSDCRGEDVSHIRPALKYIPPVNKLMFSSSKKIIIPDNDPKGIYSSVPVTSSAAKKNVLVHLNMHHTWLGDLTVALTSPNKEKITLMKRVSSSENKIELAIGQSESMQKKLQEIFASAPLGDWTLHITDEFSRDEGYLMSWAIEFLQEKSGTTP